MYQGAREQDDVSRYECLMKGELMENNSIEKRSEYSYYLGLDWSRKHHNVVMVDRVGKIVLDLQIDHTEQGWGQLSDKLVELVGENLSSVAATIETNCGPAVEKLFQLGLAVYPLNPKAAQRYRDRKVPGGGKSDLLDALSFADALRTDGHGWRRLRFEDPKVQELRLVCRDEQALIEQRTALVNRLRQALHEYYPAALEAFEDWTISSAWAFIEWFPTPQALESAGRRRWEKFLHTHKLFHSGTYQKRLDIFASATRFCGGLAVTSAKSMLAVALAKQLRVLEQQLKIYRDHIEQLFKDHPDHDLFGSLPGVGKKLGPRLLGECHQGRSEFEDIQALQCYAGTAPVRYQSGQIQKVKLRRACNKNLRNAVHMWANLSRQKSVWAQAYYQQKRVEGKSHACALRCLGQRWLKILWKMMQTNQPYDEQLHMQNQIKHGSWVLTITHTEKC